MSEHRATILWTRKDHPFAGGAYDRTHTIRYQGGSELVASSAPQYAGNPALPNPEEQLAAAVSTCHMLTFLALASKRGYVVDTYRDEAASVLGPGDDKRIGVTDVRLQPEVIFRGPKEPTQEELAKLHETAHDGCFVARALKARVHIEPARRPEPAR